MNEESIKILAEEYQSWSDDELIKAYQENDQEHYGEVAFEAMKRIAAERNLTLPSQHEFIPNPREEKSWVKTEPKKSVIPSILFIIGLFVGVCVILAYLKLSKESPLVGHYSMQPALAGSSTTDDEQMKLYLRRRNVAELGNQSTGRWKIEDGELVIEWVKIPAMFFRIEEGGVLLLIAGINKKTGERQLIPESESIRFYKLREKDKDK
jgi:hypothetical protein